MPLAVVGDDGKVRLPPADGAVPPQPSGQVGCLQEYLCAAREKRAERQHEDVFEDRRCSLGDQSSGTVGVGARCTSVPGRHQRLERITLASQGENLLMIVVTHRLVTVQDVARLAERESKVGPVERDVREAGDRRSALLVARKPLRVGLDPGQRHARLDATLHRKELELHVHGRGERRLRELELFQLCDLARIRSGAPHRSFGHVGIVAWFVGRPTGALVELSDEGSFLNARAPKRSDRSVLLVGSEALPFSKTGGLADVLGALPLALARLGWDVTVVSPRYRDVTAGELVDRFVVTIGSYAAEVGFFEVPLMDGARAVLIEEPALFHRDGLYSKDDVDYPDNPLRFAMLARAALEFASRRAVAPSVVHAHDWQAGLVPVYLKTRYGSHPMLGGAPSVFTIHNLAYQGLFEPSWLPRLDLPGSLLSPERMEYWGRISFLKGGINDAELMTTVSPTYAREIQTPEAGFGFDGILRRRAADLVGILNGIDTDCWNPERDSFLPSAYGAADLTG
ncbi:MAG: hypothetical protein DMF90_26420, partial [Acidobacteria bacterium]